MNSLISPSARVGIVAAIAPATPNPGTVTTGWIDMRHHFTLLAMIALGALGAGATVDAKIQQALDAAGTGAKDVAGTSIAQLTKASGDDNKQALINVRQTDLDFDGNFRFVRLSITVGTAASALAALVLTLDRRFGDAASVDAASVDSIAGA